MATGGGGGGVEGDPGGADGGHRDGVGEDEPCGGECDAGGEGFLSSRGLSPGRIDLDSDGDEPSPLALVPPSPRIAGLEAPAGRSSVEDHLSHYVCNDELDSERWDLYIQFDGVKFVHESMRRCDIRYLSLLNLMEKEGYGMCDSMYYVKAEGEGLDGLAEVDSSAKVEDMLQKYEASKKLVLTVMRNKQKQAIVVSPVKRNSGPKFVAKSYPSHIDLTVEQEEGEQEEGTDQFQTQNSVYCQNLHTQVDENQLSAEEEEGGIADENQLSSSFLCLLLSVQTDLRRRIQAFSSPPLTCPSPPLTCHSPPLTCL